MNWITSLFGVLTIAGGVVCIVAGQSEVGGTMIAAGLGLLAAKDARNKK